MAVGKDGVKLEIDRVADSTAALVIGRTTGVDQPPIDQSALAATIATTIKAQLENPVRASNNHSILWVDPHPSNNEYLADSFRKAGIHVVEVDSTKDAMTRLKSDKFDIVITNMPRSGDDEAGLTLINVMHSAGIRIPTIIFSARWGAAHLGQETKYGADLITNDASAVYGKVIHSIFVT